MGCSVLVGDCVASMKTLPDGCVQTCVTSPPYFGLRDYGNAAQIGLEPTPDAYVAKLVEVFREVRRVLKDDGTVWLNLGDSYASQGGPEPAQTKWRVEGASDGQNGGRSRTPGGLKPKDLIGIPWRVAFALQQPYYTGAIKDERDRIWLAAMLDAEGCMFIHRRKAGQSNGQGYERQSDSYAPGVEIANTSLAVIERVMALVGKGSICSQSPEQNNRRKQTIYRWNLRTTECREFVRELYPHLVAKQQQARVLCGCPSSGERAEAAHAGLMLLHRTGSSDVDFPAPATMFEPGFYLRQDIIWKKPNPMPESVTDRCTKAHEYIFLLSKSQKYYFDAEAIKEPSVTSAADQVAKRNKAPHKGQRDAGMRETTGGFDKITKVYETRNRRSVWTVTTKPYKGAHFATFPPDLIRPCILAGAPVGGVVLDPFGGSGTTGRVALQENRRAILCELNPEYAGLIQDRCVEVQPNIMESA